MPLQDIIRVASLSRSVDLDGALIASLTPLIAALVAIGGLVLSLHTFADTRRREVQQSALRQFQETSINLSSGSPALRSVGIEHMARYLSPCEFSETALRVLVLRLSS